MLARSAEGLYWLGRYLERAEHLSRLMEVQVDAVTDRPVRELIFGWRRIYKHLNAEPPSNKEVGFDSQSDDESVADAYTLTDDLTFEATNNYSVWGCFAQGRENARQIRHCISTEMWSCLNLSYLRIRDTQLSEIWLNDPAQFYSDLVRDISMFFGVASNTMYRDEGWDFLMLGHTLEKIQLNASILAIQSTDSMNLPDDGSRNFEWIGLLHACYADEAYQKLHGIEVDSSTALNLLVSNDDLPNSLMYAITRTDDRIHGLGKAPDPRLGDSALRFSGRLRSLIEHEWPDTDDKHRTLVLASNLADRLHNQIAQAWFNYRNEMAVPAI